MINNDEPPKPKFQKARSAENDINNLVIHSADEKLPELIYDKIPRMQQKLLRMDHEYNEHHVHLIRSVQVKNKTNFILLWEKLGF